MSFTHNHVRWNTVLPAPSVELGGAESLEEGRELELDASAVTVLWVVDEVGNDVVLRSLSVGVGVGVGVGVKLELELELDSCLFP